MGKVLLLYVTGAFSQRKKHSVFSVPRQQNGARNASNPISSGRLSAS